MSLLFADLLLDGATDANKQVFNILCEQPETVAAYLVPRVRTVVARGGGGQYIKYLTLPRALARFMTAPLRANRYFDRQGAQPSTICCIAWIYSPLDLSLQQSMWNLCWTHMSIELMFITFMFVMWHYNLAGVTATPIARVLLAHEPAS